MSYQIAAKDFTKIEDRETAIRLVQNLLSCFVLGKDPEARFALSTRLKGEEWMWLLQGIGERLASETLAVLTWEIEGEDEAAGATLFCVRLREQGRTYSQVAVDNTNSKAPKLEN